MGSGILEEVMATSTSILDVIEDLEPEVQQEAYGCLDEANRCLGEMRIWLRKARILAGVESIDSAAGNAAKQLVNGVSPSA